MTLRLSFALAVLAAPCALAQTGSGPFCLKVITGTGDNSGNVNVFVDNGDVYAQVSELSGMYSARQIKNHCFANLSGVHVSSDDDNAWAGTIELSTDSGASYSPMSCQNCGGTTSTMPIVVDKDANGGNQATTQCLNEAFCTLTAGATPLWPVLHAGKQCKDNGDRMNELTLSGVNQLQCQAQCLTDDNCVGISWNPYVCYCCQGNGLTDLKDKPTNVYARQEVVSTSTPTASPTGFPTASPTASPTALGPWNINPIGVVADFSENSEVVLKYEVGVGHEIRSELLQKGCEVPVNSSLYTTPPDEIQLINDTYQNLTRTYDFKMTEVAQSNIWNASTNKLAVCQKLHLWLPDPDGDPTTADAMDIFTDEQQIEIEFDLESNFDTIVNLAPGTTESVNQTVDFQNAVRGYKCNGGDTNPFDDYATELAPNEELAICVVSTDANIEIDELVNMISQQGATIVPIVTGGVANVAGITSNVKLDNGPTEKGVVVTTRLPLNKFTFAVNENVTISGSVKLQLTGRRLQVDRKARALVDEDFATDDGPKEAVYQVNVELKGEDGAVSGYKIPVGSSAEHATSKYAAALGLIGIITVNFM